MLVKLKGALSQPLRKERNITSVGRHVEEHCLGYLREPRVCEGSGREGGYGRVRWRGAVVGDGELVVSLLMLSSAYAGGDSIVAIDPRSIVPDGRAYSLFFVVVAGL